MPIFMTDQNDTYLSHYPNATHHTTSDTNMSFIEINTEIERSKKNPIELGKRGVSCIFGLSIYSHI